MLLLSNRPLATYQFFFLLVVCYTLASCAFIPRQSGSITQPDWIIAGKIGIKENNHRASSSLFQWKQQDDQYVIYLFNALGQIQLTLTGNQHQAVIQKANGDTATASTPEELLEQVTGWYFPVSSVRYWLQGKTQGTEQNITRSTENYLHTFSTANWQVTLEQYKPAAQQSLPHKLSHKLPSNLPNELPHKIQLQQTDLNITLIIKEHANFIP